MGDIWEFEELVSEDINDYYSIGLNLKWCYESIVIYFDIIYLFDILFILFMYFRRL